MHKDKFVERARQKHGEKFDYSLLPLKVNSHCKVPIVCNDCHHTWYSLPHNHLSGSGCKKCQYRDLPQNQPMDISLFLDKHNKLHSDRFEYIDGFINTKSIITLKCKKCGFISKKRASSHLELRLYGCKKCNFNSLPQNQPKFSSIDFECLARFKHRNRYKYYNYTTRKAKLDIKCIKCDNIFKQAAYAHLRGQGCPFCNLSYGEIAIENYLIDNNIQYEIQKSFNDCKNKQLLRFDFYLTDYKMCIEYDGQQHFEPVNRFGGIKRFNEVILHDKIKNEYCTNNNIKLIRISYKEYNKIGNILSASIKGDI